MSDEPPTGKEPLPERIAHNPHVVAPGVDRDGLYWMRENYKQQLDRSNEPKIVPMDKTVINVVGNLQPSGDHPPMTQEAVRAALEPVLAPEVLADLKKVRRAPQAGLVYLEFSHETYTSECKSMLSQITQALAPFRVNAVQLVVVGSGG